MKGKVEKKEENLNCKISGEGEGAIDSVKDVLSHIMNGSNSDKRHVSSTKQICLNKFVIINYSLVNWYHFQMNVAS